MTPGTRGIPFYSMQDGVHRRLHAFRTPDGIWGPRGLLADLNRTQVINGMDQFTEEFGPRTMVGPWCQATGPFY